MIRLTLFGGLDLVGPAGQSISSVLEQPKRLALLVYLALAGPDAFRSRDVALALFWPDSDQERARRALSQALHFLRRSLGPGVIATRGSGEIGTAANALWCDAVAFDRALQVGDAQGALRLYRGEVCPGLFVEGVPEFEKWLDEQRSAFQRRAGRAASELAQRAERDAHLHVAADWARRASELFPDDETSLQYLLQLLDRLGDRAGALRAYQAFASRLETEYAAEPSAKTRQLITQIRSRAESPVDAPPAAPVAQSPTTPRQDIHLGQDSRHTPETQDRVTPGKGNRGATSGRIFALRSTKSRLRWLLAMVLAPCVLGMWSVSRRLSVGGYGAGSPSHALIAVAPFTGLGALGTGTLGQALTTAIINQLAAVQSFEVLAGPLAAHTMPHDRKQSHVPQLQVTGNVLMSAGRVRVDVAVTDAVSGRTLETSVVEHDSTETLALIDTLARDVASLVRVTAGREAQFREWSATEKNQRAHELLQEANADGERARRLEPSGALAAAARSLADADSLLGEAEAIAPEWREPVITRAEILERLAILYWAPPFHDSVLVETLLRRGIGEAEHAISSHPNDAVALSALGSLSYWYWLMVPLQPDSTQRILARAETSLRHAVDIDPSRASAWSLLSALLYARADFAGAYLAADRAYQADAYLADTQEILNRLFISSYEIGDDSAAKHWCGEIARRFQRSWTSAYCQLSLLAWYGGANNRSVERVWRIANQADQPPALIRQMRPRLYMLVASVLAGSGMRDSAEAVMQRVHARNLADPELLPLEASVRILLDQPEAAAQLLAEYIRGRPTHRIGIARSRRFMTVRGTEAFSRDLEGCGACAGFQDGPAQLPRVTAPPLRR